MYVVGFLVVWLLLDWRIRKGEQSMSNIQYPMPNAKEARSKEREAKNNIKYTKYQTQETLLDFLLFAFFGGLLGGRIGYVIFYNPAYFLTHPMRIVSPFNLMDGGFEGLYGMSYHGALVGGIAGAWIFSKIRRINFLEYADFVVPALPLGYFFGRIGNFLNGELFGRVTSSKFGMYFASSPNVLRYPSQLFEAFVEGLLLFAVLWKVRNQKKINPGFFLFFYIAGYCAARFFCEFFRSPDDQIGFLFWGLTMGQIISIIFIIVFSGWVFFKNKKSAIIKIEIEKI